MISVLKYIVNGLINPLNILGILCFVSCWFIIKGDLRRARNSIFSLFAFFLLAATKPIPNLLVSHLEQKYETINLESLDTSLIHNILVLGGGHVADPDLPPSSQLIYSSLSRLNEGLRIRAYLDKKCHLILSGYGNRSSISQAEVMAGAAQELTNDSIVMSQLSQPSNTAEEANEYRKKFNKTDPLILVTSATHMPRAIKIFQRRGLQPISAPTDFRLRTDPKEDFSLRVFSPRYFDDLQASLHEYIGLLWELYFEQIEDT